MGVCGSNQDIAPHQLSQPSQIKVIDKNHTSLQDVLD